MRVNSFHKGIYDLIRKIFWLKKPRAYPATVFTGHILLADRLSYTRRKKDEVQRLTLWNMVIYLTF